MVAGSPHTEYHPRKAHGTGPRNGLGQLGSPQTQGFLCLHTNATAISGPFSPEAWLLQPLAGGSVWLRLGTRRQAVSPSCCRAGPNLGRLLSRHEGATCRAAGTLSEQASSHLSKNGEHEEVWLVLAHRGSRVMKEVQTSATRRPTLLSPHP